MAIRIYHVSDVHGKFHPIMDSVTEPPDLWIFTGDFFPNSQAFSMDWENSFQLKWWTHHYESFLRRLRGAPMICVDGNHDWLSLAQVSRNRGARAYEVQPGEKVLFKGLTFSGFREIPKFHGRWKGEVERIKLSSLANIIMADSPDVLLTHAPPRGIMDRTDAGEHSGNEPLAIAMASHPHNVKLHCFGHVHECGGEQETHGSTLFSNAATKLNVIDL